LRIYFSCGEEVSEDLSNGNDFKYFRARYVNPYRGEDPECTHGTVIFEEDEDVTKFDDKFKQLLELV